MQFTEVSQTTGIAIKDYSSQGSKGNLKMYFYKVYAVHQLQLVGYEAYIQYCELFKNFLEEKGEDLLYVTFNIDEAQFHVWIQKQ